MLTVLYLVSIFCLFGAGLKGGGGLLLHVECLCCGGFVVLVCLAFRVRASSLFRAGLGWHVALVSHGIMFLADSSDVAKYPPALQDQVHEVLVIRGRLCRPTPKSLS